MDGNVLVTTLTASVCTIQEVFELVHASYEQWLDNGLDSAVANYSLDDYVEKTKNCIVLVAIDANGLLLGTHTLEFVGNKCCFGKYLAVAPSAKRKGIGKKLLEKECELALAKGCDHILEDTAEKAFWSVEWHLKNGYQIVGYNSFSTNNYYSYLFRKQLVPSKKWDNKYYCKLLFLQSYLRTKLLRDRYGKPTVFRKLLVKLR